MSMSNGHDDEVDADNMFKTSPRPTRSGSELSDMHDIPTTTISSTTAPQDEGFSEDDAMHDMATSELDEDEDAPGEEDADFDMESPLPEQHVTVEDHDRSSSDTNSRPGKRKADMDDEEAFMAENPELYGLRRSVRIVRISALTLPLTPHHQGRAKPTRRVVCLYYSCQHRVFNY